MFLSSHRSKTIFWDSDIDERLRRPNLMVTGDNKIHHKIIFASSSKAFSIIHFQFLCIDSRREPISSQL